ncbi:MAG: chromosome partitioning protein, partial [Pseudomonadota bacterium]
PEEDMINAMMKDSAEIDNAAKEMKTVYDLTEPMTTNDVHRRCLRYLDRVNGELETRIRRIWPSHTDALRREAII